MSSPRKVHVPQDSGSIVITPGGNPDDARTYQVQDHLAAPRSKSEQADLLQSVPGARLATAKEEAAASKPPASPPPAGGTPAS